MGSPTQGRDDEATICLQREILPALQVHKEQYLQQCHASIYSVSEQSHCNSSYPLTQTVDYTNDTIIIIISIHTEVKQIYNSGT